MRSILAVLVIMSMMGCIPPAPQPTPSPTVEPTAEPTPTPIPASCQVVELGSGYKGKAAFTNKVRTGQSVLGDVCVCGRDPFESLRDLAAYLNADGLCAFVDDDKVMIGSKQDSELWEEHHAVFFGNGCWVATPYRYTFERKK
jgi:hypothetical protein